MPRRGARRRRLSQGNISDSAGEHPQTPGRDNNAPPAPFADLGTNDDEAERQLTRRARRKSVGASTPRSARRSRSRRSPFSGRRSNRRSRVNESDLAAMYTNAVHLSQHGKINVKNAWNLHLVDHIDDVIKLDTQKRNATDFQRASHTIDAASKIYGVRVDAVYTDTYKILGSMNQGNDNGPIDEIDGSPRRRRRNVGRVTLAGHEAISDNVKNLIESVDPLFHKTASAFDEGGARGLLMNQLYVQNGVEIVFDSETKLDKMEDETPLTFEEEMMETTRDREWIDHLAATILSESVNELPENAMSQFQQHVDELSTEIDLEWIKTIEICPLLDEFDKGIRELTLEDEKNGVDDSDLLSPPELGPSDDPLKFDNMCLNDDDVSMAEPLANDGNNFPDMPPMDAGDFGGGYDAMDFDAPLEIDADIEAQQLEAQMVNQLENNEIGIENVVGQHQRNQEPQVIGSLTSSLNMMSEMMQSFDLTDLENVTIFFDPKKHGNWAGPDQWHYRRRQVIRAKENSREGSEESVAPRGRKKRKEPAIDFESIGKGEFLDESLFDAPPRSSNCLTAAVIKKHSENMHLLPEDHQLKPSMFIRMFHKPNYNVYAHWRAWKAEQNFSKNSISHVIENEMEDEENHQPADAGDIMDDEGVRADFYDYDNPNDMMNFVPQHHPIEALDDEMDNVAEFQMFNFADSGFNMVEEPKKVENIQINFAVKSKKVDVRRLKQVMWEDIHTSSKSVTPNIENVNPNEDEKDEDKKPGVTFQNTIASIVNQIEPRQVEQLSISFCFMCLLHLANEKNLILETNPKDLGDFLVQVNEESNVPDIFADQRYVVGSMEDIDS